MITASHCMANRQTDYLALRQSKERSLAGDLSPARLAGRLQLNGYWRAFVVGLCGFAVAGALIVAFAPDLAGVYLCGLYAIPSNSVIPIPHEPGLLFFAKFYDPLWIALAATLGSAVMCFADYALVTSVMRRSTRARRSRVMQWGVRWMKRWPFAVVVAFSMVPLPVAVVRILAPASGYPVGRYVAAQIVGRFPRFYVLAVIGHAIAIPTWILVVATIGLTALLFVKGGDDEPAPDDLDAPDILTT